MTDNKTDVPCPPIKDPGRALRRNALAATTPGTPGEGHKDDGLRPQLASRHRLDDPQTAVTELIGDDD